MGDARPTSVVNADIYLNHLYLVSYARGWADRIRQDVYLDPESDSDYLDGYAQAVHDIADSLSEGAGLPGGPVYRYIQQEAVRGSRGATPVA